MMNVQQKCPKSKKWDEKEIKGHNFGPFDLEILYQNEDPRDD